MATIEGFIKNKKGDAVGSVDLTFFNRKTGETKIVKSKARGDYTAVLDPGRYKWVAVEDAYVPEENDLEVPKDADKINGPIIVLKENAIEISPPAGSPPCELSDLDEEFLKQIDDRRFSLESPISILEANQAVSLFSVVNLMLAGLGRYEVGGEEKIDMLGILNLYYGLQDKSLSSRLVVQNSDRLWRSIDYELKSLAEDSDRLQVDVDFLGREAKRQFNLGTNNSVLGSTEFPSLFRRYVEIGRDPKLSVNIEQQKENPLFDDVKREEIYNLLRDLKNVILQIVRSLSRHGTAATRRVNTDWSDFEARALEILDIVSKERVSEDLDEQTPWAVVAVLTGKNRDEFLPYVALYKHGFKLLKYAVAIYIETEDKLEETDSSHLQKLFQPQGKVFWTDRIRQEADVIKRYPLTNWG
jgi:hypothetical protein